jgi:6-phospho-3-hexuloisomerase
VQPLGTLFEQALLILNDLIILDLMQRMDVDAAQMAERHANLE